MKRSRAFLRLRKDPVDFRRFEEAEEPEDLAKGVWGKGGFPWARLPSWKDSWARH